MDDCWQLGEVRFTFYIDLVYACFFGDFIFDFLSVFGYSYIFMGCSCLSFAKDLPTWPVEFIEAMAASLSSDLFRKVFISPVG